MTTTINQEEVEKFSKISDSWWDEKGPFKPLHKINPCRMQFIRDQIYSHFKCDSLANLDIVDIGSGGGLLSEPLARLGGNITGIDASSSNVKIAEDHAKDSSLNIEYICGEASDLVDQNRKFDVVIALEIIEHVDNIDKFIEDLSKLLKDNSIMILSTINKTVKSYLSAIACAEYVLRWVPKGTHDWNKFVKPADIVITAEKYGLKTKALQGMVYNPLKNNWSLSNDLDVNYFVSFIKL